MVQSNKKDFAPSKDTESKTRYNDGPSLEILLLQSPPYPEGDRTTFVLSDGTKLGLIPHVKLVKNAIDLQRNLVSVRMRRQDQELTRTVFPKALLPYFFHSEQVVPPVISTVVPLVMSTEDSDGGEIGYSLHTLSRERSGFRYHPEQGVFREKMPPSTPTTEQRPKSRTHGYADGIDYSDSDEMEDFGEEFEW